MKSIMIEFPTNTKSEKEMITKILKDKKVRINGIYTNILQELKEK